MFRRTAFKKILFIISVYDVIKGEQMNKEVGYVGDLQGIDISPITSSIKAKCLPVLMPLAEDSSGQILNINADVAAREVAIAMKPHKTIFINAKGWSQHL